MSPPGWWGLNCRRKSCHKPGGNTSRLSTILRQKAVVRLPNFSRSKLLWMMGWRCSTRGLSFPGPDRALRVLIMSKITREANSSSARHEIALPSISSVALASIAATTTDTAVSFSGGNLTTRVTHVFSLPGGWVLRLYPLPRSDKLMNPR